MFELELDDSSSPFAEVLEGECCAAMASMPESSVDAIVTDPPYGLEFMGKEWDKFKAKGSWQVGAGQAFAGNIPRLTWEAGATAQAWHEAWAREAYRVLKPGGHLLAFGGTRTFHRLTCAIEDAGFEIRDCLSWLYGSGFPKSLDVSKAIDKAAGAEREVVGPNPIASRQPGQRGTVAHGDRAPNLYLTAPATEAAREWQGFGTALKPAWEPIILARKPLIGTVVANVLEHGTGALNIDGCRIEGSPVTINKLERWSGFGQVERPEYTSTTSNSGRWPANVALDTEAAALLDEQSGERPGATSNSKTGVTQVAYSPFGPLEATPGYRDTGGASRFFYTAKASTSERNRGMPNGERNTHPTVKPVALMRWLVRLVTPPGGRVLDPFAGSGTTLVAAIMEGFTATGIERELEYVKIARARISGVQTGGLL